VTLRECQLCTDRTKVVLTPLWEWMPPQCRTVRSAAELAACLQCAIIERLFNWHYCHFCAPREPAYPAASSNHRFGPVRATFGPAQFRYKCAVHSPSRAYGLLSMREEMYDGILPFKMLKKIHELKKYFETPNYTFHETLNFHHWAISKTWLKYVKLVEDT